MHNHKMVLTEWKITVDENKILSVKHTIEKSITNTFYRMQKSLNITEIMPKKQRYFLQNTKILFIILKYFLQNEKIVCIWPKIPYKIHKIHYTILK